MRSGEEPGSVRIRRRHIGVRHSITSSIIRLRLAGGSIFARLLVITTIVGSLGLFFNDSCCGLLLLLVTVDTKQDVALWRHHIRIVRHRCWRSPRRLSARRLNTRRLSTSRSLALALVLVLILILILVIIIILSLSRWRRFVCILLLLLRTRLLGRLLRRRMDSRLLRRKMDSRLLRRKMDSRLLRRRMNSRLP